MIFTRDLISSIFIDNNVFLYIANKTKNCIQLYHSSGLPLNIFNKQFGNDYLYDLNKIQNPIKIFIDKKKHLYVCNETHNVTQFDLNRSCIPLPFRNNDYIDSSLLHLQPIHISVKEDERICVLYSINNHNFGEKVGIYTYDGTKIHIIDLTKINIQSSFIHFHHSYLYLYNNIDNSILKFDKNGINTNFIGDEYGNEKCTLKNKKQVIYIQFLEKSLRFFIIDKELNIHFYDLNGEKYLGYSPQIIPISTPYSFYLDEESSYLYIYQSSCIEVIQLENDSIYNIQLPISYHSQSNYIPTTNMEVIQFLCSKKTIYKKILDGYKLSNQYLNENKQYFSMYYDYYTEINHKIHSYELIFILQSKFLFDFTNYQNDPFIIKYPQHFEGKEKFHYYQSKKKLYLSILQTYKEALLYQKLSEDLHKILIYDDYQNLTDNIKLIFNIDDIYLFPRVHKSQLKGIYNKKQCIIINKSLFL